MPTLGEIASYQESLLKGIPESGQSIKNINSWMDFLQKREALKKSRFELDQAHAKQENEITSSMFQNPAFHQDNPEVAMQTLRQGRDNLNARGVNTPRGGHIDQMEGQLAQGILNQDPNTMRGFQSMMRDSVNQAGGDRATRQQPEIIETPSADGKTMQRAIIERGAGGVQQVKPLPYQSSTAAPNQNPTWPPNWQQQQQQQQQPGPGQQQQSQTQNRGRMPFIERGPNVVDPIAPGEVDAYQRGKALTDDYQKISQNAPQVNQILRKSLETVNRIASNRLFETGIPGTVETLYKKNLSQNTDFQRLVKEQIQLNQQLGGTFGPNGTDSARADISTASGIGAPVDVAREVLLQNMGLSTQQQVISSLIQNPGTNNPANITHMVNQVTSLGGDLRLYTVIGIHNSDLPEKLKDSMTELVQKGMSQAEVKSMQKTARQISDYTGYKIK